MNRLGQAAYIEELKEENAKLSNRIEKLKSALNIAKRVEWVLSDGSAIRPCSGLHALLKDAIKECEVGNE